MQSCCASFPQKPAASLSFSIPLPSPSSLHFNSLHFTSLFTFENTLTKMSVPAAATKSTVRLADDEDYKQGMDGVTRWPVRNDDLVSGRSLDNWNLFSLSLSPNYMASVSPIHFPVYLLPSSLSTPSPLHPSSPSRLIHPHNTQTHMCTNYNC